MTTVIDARGLACPTPVLLVKDSIEKEKPRILKILVDNDASRENVSRFLGSKGYGCSVQKRGDDFEIEAVADEQPVASAGSSLPEETKRGESARKILILVTSNCMGKGDDTLGEKLMINFIKTLQEMGGELWQLVFINSGVRLTTASSPVLTELQAYEAAGITVLACGTCLEHFHLSAVKKVGTTTNMLDIVTACQHADKVIQVG